MKRFLLALAVTGISANAWADDIGNDQQCSQLTQGDINKACRGYDKSPSECYGLPTLFCPFDTNKVFCAHKNCEVGDVVYQDGRCYEDGTPGRLRPPNQSENGKPLVAIGVVVDPATRLAVLPHEYWGKIWWQTPYTVTDGSCGNNDVKCATMHASTCMNNLKDQYGAYSSGSSSYSSWFPAPSGASFTYCGAPISGFTDEIVQPMDPNGGLGYNWDISPLLQKILNPLRNFTPIKSAHAATANYYSYGCAIPYVATYQTNCNSMVMGGYNLGGRFYTQKLMEFADANSETKFYAASGGTSDVEIDGIKFPAASHCASAITAISGSDGQVAVSGIQPFLPSINDLITMLNNKDAIIAGLENIGLHSSWTPPTQVMLEGLWSSQQYYNFAGNNYYWNKAMIVYYSGGAVAESRFRNDLYDVACFINY